MASGTVYRRVLASGAASWVAHATWQEGGKRRQAKRSFDTKKRAQAALTELLAAHQSGTFVAPNRVTLAEFVEHLDAGPVHLFGNSMGGAVALQLAARRPDLVRSLTLISPALPSLFATKSNAHLPVIAVPGVGERLVPKYLETDPGSRVQGTIDVCYADPTRVSPQRLAESVEEVRSRDHLPYASDAFLRSLRGLLRTYLDPGPNRPWKLAERVACPTLVIYGRKDPLVDPRSAHRVTRHFRDAHVVVLPDSGHVAQMEHPEFVAAAWERFIR